jgi:TetR/AcrR family transcriptional regulator
MDQKPARKSRLSLADLERETEKFLTPATAKEKAIIDAAVALIGERGVDGATTAEIARRAGVTEKTMFRYFPSKNDLVRRVLFPIMLQRGLTRQWETREKQLKARAPSLKDWFIAAATEEMAMVVKNPGIARTVTAEMIQNDDFRGAMAELWQRHIWEPMLESLENLRADGRLRSDVDVEVLARAVHCMHVGYFLTRCVFAPGRKWDDAGEIEKMAGILAHGASSKSGNKPGKSSKSRKSGSG